MNPVLENAARCPGSYLICGPSDGRILREADAFLSRVFCEHGTGCGECPGCLRYRDRTHIDLLMLTGTKVEDAVRVPPFLSKKAFEGGLKAVLIPRLDLMNEIAQNALLKSVEEPPEDTVVVLGAVNLKAVLPTIQSRCIRVEALPDTENALARLRQKTGLPMEQAQVLLAVSGGDYPGAERLFDLHYFEVRTRTQAALRRLLFTRSKAVSQIEKLLSSAETLEFMLEVGLLYLTDLLNWKYLGPDAPVVNSDMKPQIADDSRISARRLTRVMAELHSLMERLTLCKGMNRSLALTAALLNIVEDVV